MAEILIVDDEKKINDLIAMNLQMVGHHTVSAFSGKEALECLAAQEFDLAILDIMLPETDGYELLPYFINRQIPVIYLTAKDSLSDKVQGLKMGADDYITKPFETVEMIARIEAVLRRCGRGQQTFVLGDVEVDLLRRQVKKNGKIVELTAQEYALLEILIQNCNIALSRDQILNLAWGYEYGGETRTVDAHIQRIRRKLGWEHTIQTVYKYGYRLERQV